MYTRPEATACLWFVSRAEFEHMKARAIPSQGGGSEEAFRRAGAACKKPVKVAYEQ
jgi:hypothetical protein